MSPAYFISRRLHVLNLQSNQITVIDKSIKFLRELVQLNIGHNKLTTVPVEVFQLKKLQNLDASHNEVSNQSNSPRLSLKLIKSDAVI